MMSDVINDGYEIDFFGSRWSLQELIIFTDRFGLNSSFWRHHGTMSCVQEIVLLPAVFDYSPSPKPVMS